MRIAGQKWRKSLAGMLLFVSIIAAAQTSEEVFLNAEATFERGVRGSENDNESASAQFRQLSEADAENPLFLAYYGSTITIKARDAWMPWKKLKLGDQGLDLIDKAKEIAITATPMIRPVRFKGKFPRNKERSDFGNTLEDMYVAYLHPYQITALRRNTSTGQWLDLQKAASMGRAETGNAIFSGAIGIYNSVILRSSIDVATGINGTTATVAVTTCRRAVLLGGQAAMMAFGRDNSEDKITWNEELFDHKRRLEISALTIHGLKKTMYNSVDYGVVVMSTYAAASV